MDRYFFIRPLLKQLESAGFVHRLVSITLRATAALIVLFSLVAFFKVGKVIFELPPSGILGGIFFQVCFILAIYSAAHAIIIRARDIDNLDKEVHSIFPVLTLLTKLAGEVVAFFIALVAIGGGVYVWFTGRSVATIMNPMPVFLPTFGDATFMGGIEFMVGGVLIAIVSLIVMYAVSETIGLLSRFEES
jgi:hypothetical protein